MADDRTGRHFWEDDDMPADQPLIDPLPPTGKAPRNGTTGKVDVITDRADTIDRLSQLDDAVQFAEYELRAGVALARFHGMAWKEVAEAIGTSTQNAQQRFSGKRLLSVGGLDEDERARIGRLIGLRERTTRFVVRRWVSGRKGVTRVVYEDLSRHLKIEAAGRALEKARAIHGADRVELLKEWPDGTRRPVDL